MLINKLNNFLHIRKTHLYTSTAIMGAIALFSTQVQAACTTTTFSQTVNSASGAVAINTDTDPSLKVTSTGTINNGAGDGISATGTSSFILCIEDAGSASGSNKGVTTSTLNADVNNNGTIIGNGGEGIYLSNGGTVSNLAAGTITGSLSAVHTNTLEGNVINAGSINSPTNYGVYLAEGGTVDNLVGGTINGTIGVNADNASMDVTNAGTITASMRGVNLEAGGNLDNKATGVITSTSSGVTIYHDTASTLTNAGSITGINSRGVYLYNAGTVNNLSGGSITGGTIGIKVDSGDATITNAGTITGSDYSILGGSGVETITNSGTLTGNLDLGGDADTLTLMAGSVINGTADGGDGIDNLNIEGTQTLGTVSNFEIVTVKDGTVEWNDASTNLDSLTLSNATLSFGGTATIVSVNEGSSLSGAGTFGVLTSSGVIAPGNSAGILSVTGDYNMTSTATYEAEIYANTTHDLIDVGGAASLDGSLEIQLGDNATNYNISDTFTILSAAGGISGNFASSTATGASTTLYPVYNINGNDVVVSFINPTVYFSGAGKTENQKAAAAILPTLALGSLSGQSLFTAEAATINSTLEELSGSSHGSMAYILTADSNEYMNAILSETNSVSDGVLTSWMKVYGLGGTASSDGNASGYEHDTKGLAFGFGYGLSKMFTVGVHGGYSWSDATIGSDIGEGRSKEFGVYATGQFDKVLVKTAFSHGWHDVKLSRTLSLAGTAANNADTSSNKFQLETSLPMQLNQFLISPVIGYNYTKLDAISIHETGAGIANLIGSTSDYSSSQARGGLRASFESNLGSSGVLTPSMQLMYVSELGDLNGSHMSTFEGLPANSLVANGLTMDKGRIELDAGINIKTSGSISFNIGYRGIYMENFKSHGGNASITLVW